MSSPVTTAVTRGRHEVRRLLSPYPSVFLPLMRRRPAHADQVIDDTTEVVIEGFPRSGNTFSVAAFQHAQGRPVAIARHLHAPAHVIEGVRRDLPVVLVVRDPLDAVASQIVRHPDLTPRAGLREYVWFHRHVLPYAEGLIVAPFEQVTSDFGVVIDAVNSRFGTAFERFDHTPENLEAAFRMVEEMERDDRTRRHSDPTATVARPVADRESLKSQIRQRLEASDLSDLAQSARKLRTTLLERWQQRTRRGPGS